MHPGLVGLESFWASLRRGDALPSRSDFTPHDLRPWLGHVGLVDVEAGPRFRVRLAGTALVSYDGEDVTGRYLDQVVPAPMLDEILAPYHRLLASRAPVHCVLKGGALRGTWRELERLLLPLAQDGRTISMILVGIFHNDEPTARPRNDVYGRPLADR